jgi:hypothetical protein
MPRTTLGQVKEEINWPETIGYCSTDPRVVAAINKAQRRLLKRGLWWGCYGRYRMCVTDGCITWPRQFATIEMVSVCDRPVTIRNEWFEFIENGPGLQDGEDCGPELYDRGTAISFNDVQGSNKKIKVYADVAESAGSKILLQGYDENGNWIRTLVSGEYVDGEYVAISTTPTLSTKTFSSLTGVQKPVTNGTVRIYTYDTVALTQRALAIYEPNENIPSYRRSLITGLDNIPDGETRSVTVMAKHEFIPAVKDTDYLVIGNIDAIEEMCASLKKARDNIFQEAELCEQRAIRELQKELEVYLGSGTVVNIRTPPREIYGGAVENVF